MVKTTQSIEIMEEEVTSGEQLNIPVNQSNYLKHASSHKSNHVKTRNKSINRNYKGNHTSQNEGGTNNR